MVEWEGRKKDETVGETSRVPLLDSVLVNISCDLLGVVWCNEQQMFSLHLFNLPFCLISLQYKWYRRDIKTIYEMVRENN